MHPAGVFRQSDLERNPVETIYLTEFSLFNLMTVNSVNFHIFPPTLSHITLIILDFILLVTERADKLLEVVEEFVNMGQCFFYLRTGNPCMET